jgi:anti-sigma B factor antagonist
MTSGAPRLRLQGAAGAVSLPGGRLTSGADMEWGLRKDGRRVIAAPSGRVDEDSWKEFGAHLSAAVRDAVADKLPLVIDLSGLDYMTSKGLRALTVAKNEAAGAVTITLAAPNQTMRRILSISRYNMLFPVVDDVDQAG